MSSFQGAGLETRPHFRGGVLISGGWIREVSSFRGAGLEGCPHFSGLD